MTTTKVLITQQSIFSSRQDEKFDFGLHLDHHDSCHLGQTHDYPIRIGHSKGEGQTPSVFDPQPQKGIDRYSIDQSFFSMDPGNQGRSGKALED